MNFLDEGDDDQPSSEAESPPQLPVQPYLTIRGSEHETK